MSESKIICPYCKSRVTIRTADKVDLAEGFRKPNSTKEITAKTKVNGILACIAELFKDGGEENVKIENGKRILRCSFHLDLTDTDLTSEDIGNAFEERIETKQETTMNMTKKTEVETKGPMTFSEALSYMKEDHRPYRKSWFTPRGRLEAWYEKRFYNNETTIFLCYRDGKRKEMNDIPVSHVLAEDWYLAL